MSKVIPWSEISKSKYEVRNVVLRPSVEVKHKIRFVMLPYLMYRIWWDNTWFNLTKEDAMRLHKLHPQKIRFKPRPTLARIAYKPDENVFVVYEANQRIAQALGEWGKAMEKDPSSIDGSAPVFVISKTGQGKETRYTCVAGESISLTEAQKKTYQDFIKSYDLKEMYPLTSFDEMHRYLS